MKSLDSEFSRLHISDVCFEKVEDKIFTYIHDETIYKPVIHKGLDVELNVDAIYNVHFNMQFNNPPKL